MAAKKALRDAARPYRKKCARMMKKRKIQQACAAAAITGELSFNF